MNIKEIKANPNNPRVLRDDKFNKLKKSIQDFPQMMELRPIIVDENNVILGGNMRFRVLQDLGYKEIHNSWVKKTNELTEEQKKEFIIKDNVGFGDWDWDLLNNEWDIDLLNDWGLNIPEFANEVDYSILDDEDTQNELNSLTDGVKKAIQIEFDVEHYQDAYDIIKFWREQGAYVGYMVMNFLKMEKEKI